MRLGPRARPGLSRSVPDNAAPAQQHEGQHGGDDAGQRDVDRAGIGLDPGQTLYIDAEQTGDEGGRQEERRQDRENARQRLIQLMLSCQWSISYGNGCSMTVRPPSGEFNTNSYPSYGRRFDVKFDCICCVIFGENRCCPLFRQGASSNEDNIFKFHRVGIFDFGMDPPFFNVL